MASRGGRWTALFLVALLALAGCGELRPPGAKKHYLVYHTVRSGDTLYSIAWRYGYDYREVAAWNKIKQPYRIYVGQRLLIIPPGGGRAPLVEERGSSVASTPVPAPEPKAASRRPATQQGSSPPRNTPVEKPVSRPHATVITWQWPTAGKVLRGFTSSDSKKGIDINGRSGQPVYAASGGDVVYSGSGLVGYGNLVIIKHDDVYLSAYGHNRRLLVKEGDKVTGGQIIAEMGQTSRDGAILHFEIRQEGKPVDPMRYLPKQNL